MEHKKWRIPPKMQNKTMFGGISIGALIITLILVMVAIAIVSRAGGATWAWYAFLLPAIYAVMSWQTDDGASGADFFRKCWHFVTTPQTEQRSDRKESDDILKKMTPSSKPADWLYFEFCNDHVVTGAGPARREHYLVRLSPRNMEILGEHDRYEEEFLLQTLLDGCDTLTPSFFILDKTEGMGPVRAYQQELRAKNSSYEDLYDEILRQLDGMEAESASVERAFYLVLSVRERTETDLFLARLREIMPCHVADREEWIVVLRNFLLREYTPFSLAQFDAMIDLKYQAAEDKEQRRRRPRPVSRDAIAKEETRRLLLPLRMAFNTRHCEQNDFLRRTMVVRNYPAQFERDGILRQIGCMENTTVRIYLEPLKGHETSALINKQTQNVRSKYTVGNTAQKIAAESEAENLRQTYAAMLENNEKMFHVTILIEVYASDVMELNKRCERVKNALLSYGITKDDLIADQKEAFLSMLPFGKKLINVSRAMPSSTFAAMYPFTASKKVDDQGLLLGRTASRGPVIWDPYLRNDAITSGNMLVVGAPGQGKSYLMKKIISLLIARGISVYTLDPENEYGDLFTGLGCSCIECGVGGYIINPLEVRRVSRRGDDTPIDVQTPDAFRETAALRQHISWLREFIRILFPEITDRELNILSILLREHYQSYGIDDAWDPDAGKPSDYPTFGTLYEYCAAQYESFDAEKYAEFNREDLQNILLQLREVYDGSLAPLFNGITNVPTADVINFQLQTLLQGAGHRLGAVMFNIMTWVMGRLISGNGEKQALVVDEVYLTIDRRNPTLILWLRNYAKRDRKYEGILCMCTQSLGDFADPEIVHITAPLLQLPPHKFIFHLGDVEDATVKNLLRLDDSEIALIRHSRKRHCLLKCGNDKYYLEVGTLGYEKDLFGGAGGR